MSFPSENKISSGILLLLLFVTPVLNSQGMKTLRYAIQKKDKNQAGMNLTPPPPS